MLRKRPWVAPATASARSQSSNTTLGDFPPKRFSQPQTEVSKEQEHTQFQGHFLEVGVCCSAHDSASYFSRASERDLVKEDVSRGPCDSVSATDLVNLGVHRYRLSGGSSKSRDDVQHSRWQPSLHGKLSKQKGRKGGQLGGLEYDTTTNGESGSNLPRCQHKWKVPRHDCANNSKGRACDKNLVVWIRRKNFASGQFVHPASVVAEDGRRLRSIIISSSFNGFAVVQRFQTA